MSSENVNVSFFAKKNKNTVFDGYNYVGRYSNVRNTTLGFGSYIGSKSFMPDCIIGKFCSIGSNVQVTSGNHPTSVFVSTHPAFYSVSGSTGLYFVNRSKFKEFEFADDKGHKAVIGNDVWISSNVLIVAPVKIGNGAVVAAGAVVTEDVEPYTIVGGVPAKVIGRRFDETTCEKINSSEWWNWDLDTIRKNADFFDNAERFLTLIEKDN